jgi:outer membrane protein W
MRRTLSSSASKLLVAAVCVAVTAQSAAAQAKPSASAPAFGMGYTDIGPTVGLGGLGGASADFGGRFEHAIKPLPDMGNGMLGIQVAAEYYSWSASASGAGFTYSSSIKYIPIGVTANYHFNIADQPKFDPFVGLGLGYNIVSCSYSSNFGSSFTGNCGYSSGIYFIGRAGARYFFSPKLAGYADVGAGGATLNLGVMFKLN